MEDALGFALWALVAMIPVEYTFREIVALSLKRREMVRLLTLIPNSRHARKRLREMALRYYLLWIALAFFIYATASLAAKPIALLLE